MVGSDKHFVNMFVGANGTSKTATGVNIITNIVYGIQNEWFEHPLFQKFPYSEKKGRIISDPTTIKEKIIPELRKWFPANEAARIPDANFEEAKEGKSYVCKITTNTGWTIDIMSTEQEKKEFESVDLSWIWIDEPIPQDRFIASLARGRLGMIVFWTYTPLFGAAWIKDWMDKHLDSGEAGAVEAEAEENCKVHGIRGIFEHAHIKRIADSIPEDEKEARIFGRFGHLLGRVHKIFRRSIHVIPAFSFNEKDYTTYMALDTHPRVPDHALYLSVNRNGRKFISGEVISEGGVKTLYNRLVEFETKMHFRIQDRIIDPSAFNDDQHTEENSVGRQLMALGMIFIRGSKDLMAGIKRLDDALKYTVKESKMIVSPELYICDNNPTAIKQIEEYVWSEYKGPSKDDKKPNPNPKDRNDHQPENLHRLLLHEPTFVPHVFKRRGPRGDYDQEMNDLDPYTD